LVEKEKHLNVDVWKRGFAFVKCIVCEPLKDPLCEELEIKLKKKSFNKNFVDVYITPRKLSLCNLKKISYV
jgi:hypothetical protein